MHIQLSFISIVILLTYWLQPQNKVSQVVIGTPTTVEVKVDSLILDRLELIEFAKKYIGTPYRYASLDPMVGFDCSGFVRFVFKHFNINLPRSSREYDILGAAQKPEDFKVGDILIFYGFRDSGLVGHVGIICEADGMKSKFIHSSSGKVHGVTISQLSLEQYTRRFYKCIDVISIPAKLQPFIII